MIDARSLADLLNDSVRRHAQKAAIAVPDGEQVTYAELGELSDRVRDRLHRLGVLPGDRVGLVLHKSIGTVALIFGILKAGATYVPVDAESPVPRAAYILSNCQVKVVVVEESLQAQLVAQLRALDFKPLVVSIPDGSTARLLAELLRSLHVSDPAPAVGSGTAGGDDIAYLLYTSGSTGAPKGVMLSHANALSFVDWCSDTLLPTSDDRFSSHAPFHFDLSIFDLYVAIKHGATLVLIEETLGREPMRLAQLIASERITIWYSTPSILGLLAHYGKLKRYDYAALRLVLFAGEVFPISQYSCLRAFWHRQRFVNLYGPTETNVCTWFEIPDDERVGKLSTFPIGKICSPNLGMVVDELSHRVTDGESGELLVSGPNVMHGYWNRPDLNARVFHLDGDGRKWYRTGDIVAEDPDVGYRYIGRRDRMVKRRGYRVELGEIEVTLLRDPDVREAAVVAVNDAESGIRIAAFVSCAPERSLSLIALKRISARSLPRYMIPDSFVVLDAIPRTATNKVNYEALKVLTTPRYSEADAAATVTDRD
jgi:amino acid adenylation domain-containing protein